MLYILSIRICSLDFITGVYNIRDRKIATECQYQNFEHKVRINLSAYLISFNPADKEKTFLQHVQVNVDKGCHC